MSSSPSPRPTSARLLPSALAHSNPYAPPDASAANSPSASSPRHISAIPSPAPAAPAAAAMAATAGAYASGASFSRHAADANVATTFEDSTFPPFQPFFTLVEDAGSQSTVHPSVSYIFADDDHDPITNAAIRIDASAAAVRPPPTRAGPAPKRPPDPIRQQSQSPAIGPGTGTGAGAGANPRRRSAQGSVGHSSKPGSPLPAHVTPAGPGGGGGGSSGAVGVPDASQPSHPPASVQQPPQQQPTSLERCVLVTLGPDGRSVASAVSLTPDWHVNAADLCVAPTLDGDGGLASMGLGMGTGTGLGVTGTGTSPGAGGGGVAVRRVSGAAADMAVVAGGSTPVQMQMPMQMPMSDVPLMLRIHGSGVPCAIGRDEAFGMGIDNMCEAFKERLGELRKVVQAAEAEAEGR